MSKLDALTSRESTAADLNSMLQGVLATLVFSDKSKQACIQVSSERCQPPM
jgi:hypothetical protein